MDSSFLSAPRLSEKDLEKEQKELTDEDKKKIHNDLHGITSPPLGEEKLETHIKLLSSALDDIPSKDKAAYLRAKEAGAEFTRRKEDLLMFLHAECYNAQAAARRIVSYWQNRLMVFSESEAFCPLSRLLLEKGTEEDAKLLPMNVYNMLPRRDDFGRLVFFFDHSKKSSFMNRRALTRLLWCTVHGALEKYDPLNPHRGDLVMISLVKNCTIQTFNRKHARMYCEFFGSMVPLRTVAYHSCHPPPIMAIMKPVTLKVMGKRLRLRLVPHKGSDKCVLEQLSTFGLPQGLLPRELGGTYIIPQYENPACRKRAHDAEITVGKAPNKTSSQVSRSAYGRQLVIDGKSDKAECPCQPSKKRKK